MIFYFLTVVREVCLLFTKKKTVLNARLFFLNSINQKKINLFTRHYQLKLVLQERLLKN
jgi:hypothetical protein